MAKTAETNFANFAPFATVSGDAARKGFERSMALVGEMTEFNKQNLAAFAESARIAGKTVEVFSTRATAYVKEMMEDMMATGRTVSTAKSVKEAIEAQAEYAKTSFDRYLEEMNAMSGLIANSVKDCVEPLNAQAGEFVAMMQRRV